MNELNATRLPHRRRVIRQWRECPGQQGGVAGVNNNLTKIHHPQHLTSGLLLFDLGKPIFVFRQWAGEGDIQTINHANVWALIFDVCRVSTGDPVGAWQKHVAVTKARRDRMNALELDRIHMTSSNGTDLTVGLADDATWEGASSKTEDGIEFIANVPTEEVFCAPHRERTNGIVYGTKPYAYNGQLIEGWHVTFKDGVVVEHGAEKNADLLAELLSTDENSDRIGEIALVPASSPINRSGVLFYNTLFDENAACHIAFGAGYPTNIRGGSAMTRDDLMKKGLNNSAIHEDVMIGAADTHVTGITKRREEVTIFENGEWAF